MERVEKERAFQAKSVICYAVPYYTQDGDNISKYALSQDYHIYMASLANRLCEYISENFKGSGCYGFCDHSPLDEVSLAAKCGLGVVGENRLLITEKYSSFVFIGEVFTDIEPKMLGYTKAEQIKTCINCKKCESACPTMALSSLACECFSSITQKKGELSDSEIKLIEKIGSAWGCDICQDVCPYTKKAIKNETILSPIQFFHENKIAKLDCDIMDAMDENEFSMRAYSWRKRETIKRNLEILKKAEYEKAEKNMEKENVFAKE